MKFHFHIILTLNSSIFLIFTLSFNSKCSSFSLLFLLFKGGAEQIIFSFLFPATLSDNFTLVGCCLSSMLIISPNQHPQILILQNKKYSKKKYIEPENTFNWNCFTFIIYSPSSPPTDNNTQQHKIKIEIIFSSTSFLSLSLTLFLFLYTSYLFK